MLTVLSKLWQPALLYFSGRVFSFFLWCTNFFQAADESVQYGFSGIQLNSVWTKLHKILIKKHMLMAGYISQYKWTVDKDVTTWSGSFPNIDNSLTQTCKLWSAPLANNSRRHLVYLMHCLLGKQKLELSYTDMDLSQNPRSGLLKCLKLAHRFCSSTLFSKKILITDGTEHYDDLGCCHLPIAGKWKM